MKEKIIPVNVWVYDEAGNYANCMASVHVLDKIAPVAICRDKVVYLDRNGRATINASDINNGSYDNCSIENIFTRQGQIYL